jgi:hypothetical protein
VSYSIVSTVTVIHKSDIDILIAVPLTNCNTLLYVMGTLILVVAPSKTTLFFLRVKAVYANNKNVAKFFGFLWFVVFAFNCLAPFATKAARIPSVRRCYVAKIEPYGLIPILAHISFDSPVFAISLRILSFSVVGDTLGDRARSFFRGEGLPNLSKSVLHGGQLYYLSVAVLFVLDVQ